MNDRVPVKGNCGDSGLILVARNYRTVCKLYCRVSWILEEPSSNSSSYTL